MDLAGVVRGVALQGSEILFSGLCIVIIAVFVLFLFIAIWVYRDAESRGMSGVLWLLVVLVAGIIGLIIYLIVRSDHPVRPPGWMPPAYPGYYPPGYAGGYPPAQPRPGWAAPPPTPFAPAGPPAAAATVTCRNCGTASPAGVKFCRQCGATL